ncbi:amidohydrolase family protein [Lactobacillus sp. ESL0677]|uniref:metal-dependent hydrolase family protein n=1 Tax=Lactobacillus sp. ESL0677 TaxID=2983208 RepID=UPI0023F9817D|nr:amidohydrolase family protein [Lactobacillus sp. ESL0677]WEV37622.1 amidohydrolase family protein [Lactobacillus sp. ESL0677]
MTQTVYQNMNLYDGEEEKVTSNSYFVVDDETGKIMAMGTGSAPAGDKVVDLEGKFVMPGLINCHTHINNSSTAYDGDPTANVVETTVRAVQHLHDFLKSGVTYIRECGSTYDIDITLARMIEEGKITKTPEIMPSGMAYSMTGGHGDSPHFAHLVDSPDEMRKAVRQGLKKGAKNIKVMATGGVMTKNDFMDDPQLSVAEMRAAVEEAHHKGLIVAAHAEGNVGIGNAIKAGVDSIEHGFYVDDDQIDMMLKQGTYLTATVVADWAFPTYAVGIMPDWEVKKASDALDDLRKNITHAKNRGVKITLGTDAGTPFNDYFQTPTELQLLTEQGFTNYEALQTSVHSAQLMKIDDEYGTLAIGKYADFLVLDENPLTDVKAVAQKDKAVYKKGQRAY